MYQYITVNTKNMATKIVKGLRQQNESEGEINKTKAKLSLTTQIEYKTELTN